MIIEVINPSLSFIGDERFSWEKDAKTKEERKCVRYSCDKSICKVEGIDVDLRLVWQSRNNLVAQSKNSLWYEEKANAIT